MVVLGMWIFFRQLTNASVLDKILQGTVGYLTPRSGGNICCNSKKFLLLLGLLIFILPMAHGDCL